MEITYLLNKYLQKMLYQSVNVEEHELMHYYFLEGASPLRARKCLYRVSRSTFL